MSDDFSHLIGPELEHLSRRYAAELDLSLRLPDEPASFADAVGLHAAGSLAAQRALEQLRTHPDSDGVLLAALESSPRWRTSTAYVRAFLREIEKALTR